jgi:pimeloyl-ACP methyl ester carboxylesterase
MSFFDFRGHRVWYESSGTGPAMVFLHNGGNDHRIWDLQAAHFARTNRVILVDHLGFGNSDCPEIDYTLPLYTEQVATLIETLKLERVILVGHCIGGAMALNYTLAHPERVEKLVLFNVATEGTLCAGPLAATYRKFHNDAAAMRTFVDEILREMDPRVRCALCAARPPVDSARTPLAGAVAAAVLLDSE